MKNKICWIIAMGVLVLSLQGCFIGVDPGWHGHGGGGGGGYHGNGGHGEGGGHHR